MTVININEPREREWWLRHLRYLEESNPRLLEGLLETNQLKAYLDDTTEAAVKMA